MRRLMIAAMFLALGASPRDGMMTGAHAAAPPPTPVPGSSATPAVQEPELYERLCGEVAGSFDSTRGGFVRRDDTPIESAVELALARGRAGDGEWAARGLLTVRWMRALLDTLGGGFVTRAREAERTAPAFSKRTVPNARRLENLVDAWRVSGDPLYRRDGARVIEYFERVLADGRGGFAAAQVGGGGLEPLANGEAIHAWLRWAAATGDPRARDFALRSVDRVWSECWDETQGLLARDEFGRAARTPRLEDQSAMGRAAVLAAHLGGRAIDLQRAEAAGRMLLARFEDPEEGGFRTQAAAGRDTKVKRAARVSDENARAARFLAELAAVSGDGRYREAARRARHAFERELERGGPDAADWALAVRAAYEPDLPQRPEWTDGERTRARDATPPPSRRKGRR